jgi:hypothetical protein
LALVVGETLSKHNGSGCIKRDALAVNENFQHNVRKLLILKSGVFD